MIKHQKTGDRAPAPGALARIPLAAL